MALDLFANYERLSNNSTFYRELASEPYTFSCKLSDLDADEDYPAYLNQHFVAKYSINNSLTLNSFDLLSGENVEFQANSPSVSSISVFLYDRNTETFDTSVSLETYKLSAVFVKTLPKADFILYPERTFERLDAPSIKLNSKNFYVSQGVAFYGEGHTETIYLSSYKHYSNTKFNWFVGNTLTEINRTSLYSVSSTNELGTLKTAVSSTLNQETQIPVSLRLTTYDILSSGPIFKYDDNTGERKFYPFFFSTLNEEGNHKSTEDRFKHSIQIQKYPNVISGSLQKPFNVGSLFLPEDNSTKFFTSFINFPNLSSSTVSQTLASTKWRVSTEIDSFYDDGNWSYTTQELSGIDAYRFGLSYETKLTEILPVFKISSFQNTTVTVSVSAKKLVQIKESPYDWLTNEQIEVFQDTAVVSKLPQIKIATQTYYCLTDIPVSFEIILPEADSRFELRKIKINSQTTSYEFIPGQSKMLFDVTFTKTGLQTLTAECLYLTENNSEVAINTLFPSIVEVLNYYDKVEDIKFYRSEEAEFVPQQNNCPLIPPNEWAVKDTANNVMSKLFDTIDEIKNSTFRYTKASFVYGWLGNDVLSWSDLECFNEGNEQLTWNNNLTNEFLQQDRNGYPLIWGEQECDTKQIDPSCLQKYCLVWNWKSRRKQSSKVFTTWKALKENGQYEKRWKYEPCEVDSVFLNCDKGKWHYSTIDPDSFPIPICSSDEKCQIVSSIKYVDPKTKESQVILAHKSEINVFTDSYTPIIRYRRGNASGTFNFVDIQAMAINHETSLLYVLDATLASVCVYDLTTRDLLLKNTWGKFGTQRSHYGFNKPKDIFLDPNGHVWVVDYGNFCLKHYTSTGTYLKTVSDVFTEETRPISMCSDSDGNLHVLVSNNVVYILNGSTHEKIKEYALPKEVNGLKIRSTYNKEIIYVSYSTGVVKFFKTGTFFGYLLKDVKCANEQILDSYLDVHQDSNRNVLVTAGDKVLVVPDRMKTNVFLSTAFEKYYWDMHEILIEKEEYIQPHVYLRAFHRLWDNIELIRNSLIFDRTKNSEYLYPKYLKEELVIGENELVTSTVINRLTSQLWTNINSLLLYF